MLAKGEIPGSFDDTVSFDDAYASFPIIVDSGASLAISPNQSDFVGHIEQVDLS